MRNRSTTEPARRMFLLGAGLILAHQVAGKAVRDGLFLSRFSPGDLPKVVMGAALVSVLLGLGFARVLARYGPLRVVPAAFAAGALLHLVEFALLLTAGETARGAVISLVYVHLTGLGAILLSGFWSVAGEVFDPRRAKREFGRIAGAGTVGGIAGGVLAERGAAVFGGDSLLVLLAVLHVAAWLTLSNVASRHDSPTEPPDMGEPWQAAREAFRQAPFLVNLCVLVLLGTLGATLLDYLFKSGAAAAYGKGPQPDRAAPQILQPAGHLLRDGLKPRQRLRCPKLRSRLVLGPSWRRIGIFHEGVPGIFTVYLIGPGRPRTTT